MPKKWKVEYAVWCLCLYLSWLIVFIMSYQALGVNIS